MSKIAKVQSRGQVTVPQEIREACGLAPGDELLFVQTGARTFECHALPRRRTLAEALAQYQSDDDPPDLAQLRQEFGAALARRSWGAASDGIDPDASTDSAEEWR